jgi:hypothetical protein
MSLTLTITIDLDDQPNCTDVRTIIERDLAPHFDGRDLAAPYSRGVQWTVEDREGACIAVWTVTGTTAAEDRGSCPECGAHMLDTKSVCQYHQGETQFP